MPKTKSVEKTEPQIEEVEQAPAGINFSFQMPAYKLYEIVKVVNAVASYGKDSKDNSDLNFHVGNEGLSFKAMDSARVAMVDFELKKYGFDLYKLESEGDICFDGATLLSLLKGVKRETHNPDGSIKSEGTIAELTIHDVDLTLKLTHSNYSRVWNLKAVAPENLETPQTPKLQTAINFKTETSRLAKVLEDAQKASDFIRITADNKHVHFEAEGDIVKFESELTKQNGTLMNLECKTDGKACYNTDLLLNILKNLPRDTLSTTFSFSRDMPCILETGAYDKLTFYIAPRIGYD